MALDPFTQPFVVGHVDTPAGRIPQVDSVLTRADRLGTLKARWGVGRMDYLVEPGLYALNRPDHTSPVLVTANYKLTFDHLRSTLASLDAWLLVLDSKGINVWCAAGKGTFGTEELARRIAAARLEEVVSHREVVLPQLSGPGVAAFRIKKLSGFKALFGPIMAADIPAFLAAGNQATSAMRRKDFPLRERLVLIPVELVQAAKPALYLLAALALAGGILGRSGFWANFSTLGPWAAAGLATGILAGAVLMPLLLPWLPGRAFSLKGLWTGLACGLGFAWFRSALGGSTGLEAAGWALIILAASSFLAMNFTGSSTYTSLSGVKKEMRRFVPLQIGLGLIGLGLWTAGII